VTNKLITNVILIWSILAGYFAFTDLQLSIWFVNTSSGWAKFLEDFGEVPGLLVLYSGTFISMLHFLSSNIKFKFPLMLLLFLVATFISIYFIAIVFRNAIIVYSFINNNLIFISILFLSLNLFAVYLLRNTRLSKLTLEYGKQSVLLGFWGYLVVIQPIKHIWGRIRFRDLDSFYSNFTPWFLPNGINGNQSFPSGHAAMSWMILPILMLTPDNTLFRSIIILFIIIWGLIVPVSRVVIGAHYASDALFGACIIILSYLIIKSKNQFEFNSESK
jgi:membrane-associated phospholipid phosphatase